MMWRCTFSSAASLCLGYVRSCPQQYMQNGERWHTDLRMRVQISKVVMIIGGAVVIL